MIETKQTITIQDLALHEPQIGNIQFSDPRKEFSKADWDGLGFRTDTFLHMVTDPTSQRWWDIDSDFLLNVGLLNPEIIRSRVRGNNAIWEKLTEQVPVEIDGENLAKAMATLKIVDPERFNNENILTPDRWESIKLDSSGFSYTYIAFPTVGYMRIVDPEKASQIPLEPENWLQMNRSIKAWKENEGWEHVASLATDVKIAFPTRMEELAIGVRDWRSIWNYMKEKFEAHKTDGAIGDTEEFLEWSTRMAILAARDINVTSNGIQMTYGDPHEFTAVQAKIPTRRRF